LKARLLFLVIILAADVGSALGVVYMRHQARHLSVELGNLEKGRDAAVAEWSRLQLEQATLADAGQIELKAREQLAMMPPAKSNIMVVRP
jgi:cell division protein FtsL